MKKVISLVLILTLVLLAGCGAKKGTPEAAVEDAINAIKKLDKDEANKYFNYDSFAKTGNDAADENAKYIVENIKYDIKSTTGDDKKATVKVEITNVDFKKVMQQYLKKALSTALSDGGKTSEKDLEKKMTDILVDIIKDNKKNTVTKTVDIKLTKDGENWKLDMTEDLQNALLGGLLDFKFN